MSSANVMTDAIEEQPILPADNPFASPSTLPFGAPPFDRIRDEHYEPAIEAGMRAHRDEVAAIAHQEDAPTFENTIAALEASGVLLTRVLKAFGGVTSANTNDFLQAVQTQVAPKLAAHSDAIYLDEKLFARVRAVHTSRLSLGLPAEELTLVERYHLDFVRAGARLSDADKERLKALNQEESRLTTEFQNRLLAANKAGALVIDDPAELEGMSESDIAAAAEAAAERGLEQKWLVRLQNTTQQPVQETLRRRTVRRRLFEAAIHRADRGDAHDTTAIVLRLAALRAERAGLLGYENAAAYTLDDQMAKTPGAAIRLLVDIGKAAVVKARAEGDRMRLLAEQDGHPDALEPWDWQFYAERVRKADYDLDEAQIRPYFELDRVLNDGVFFAATRMFGLTFRERHDIPVYHPDVRVFDVFDEDGSQLGLFYADYFKRDNKSGGAWMDSFVDQSELLANRPVVFNVTNYTKPAPGQPALLSFDEVTTLFHEFGHALHGMLSRVRYPTLSGTNVPRDFVEFPSQFNEHCALDPVVLANYARHHRTGEPMPQAMVDRIKRARTFNQGFALTEYIGAALLDMAWHTTPTATTSAEIEAFETAALERYGLTVREVPPRYRSTYFAHIWDGGYGGGYYAYLWAEVLDHDAFKWFTERGGLTRENGQRYREMILSCGGTRDAALLYRQFRGRDPKVEPLLGERGLTMTADPAA